MHASPASARRSPSPSQSPRTRWRSILEKDSSTKYPWDPSKIPSIVHAGIQPRASMEARLRCAFTLRRAMENATPTERVAAMRMPMVGGAIQYFLDHSDGSPSCARLQEHALMTLVHCLGCEARLDEELILDDGTIKRLHACLESTFVVVVAAACQLVRRISELDHICTVLAFDESLYNDLLTLLECVCDSRVRTHLLSTLINMAAHAKLQFMLARSARLVQWLVDAVFDFTATLGEVNGEGSRTTSSRALSNSQPHSRGLSSQPTTTANGSTSIVSGESFAENAIATVKCVRALANLLSYPLNRAEMQRMVPSIYDAMLNCQHPLAPEDLAEAGKCVVHLLHDNPAELHFELTAELARRPHL